MQHIITSIIKEVQDSKKKKGIVPLIVPMEEIQTRIIELTLKELRTLVRNKVLKYHQTLNGHAFSIGDS